MSVVTEGIATLKNTGKFKIAKMLIALFGGVDTHAIITGYENRYDAHFLVYEYSDIPPNAQDTSFSASALSKIPPGERGKVLRRMIHGTWGRTFRGTINTGWDIVHIACSRQELPKWKETYSVGYEFPVRYLKPIPGLHCILEHFDFGT